MKLLKFRQYAEIASYIAQILLLVLAVFGYFYTVRPVYQRDYLEEEIAQAKLQYQAQKAKELILDAQLNHSQQQLMALESQIQSMTAANKNLTAENRSLEKNRESLKSEVAYLLGSQRKLTNSIDILRKDLVTPRGTLAESPPEVRAALWLRYVNEVSTIQFSTTLWYYNSVKQFFTYDEISGLENGSINLIIKTSPMYQEWKKFGDKVAVGIILGTVQSVRVPNPDVKGVDPKKLQAEFNATALRALNNHMNKLLCHIDLDNLNNEFNKDIKRASQKMARANEALTKKYNDLYDSYSAKNYVDVYKYNEAVERQNIKTDFLNDIYNGNGRGSYLYTAQAKKYLDCVSVALTAYEQFLRKETPQNVSSG